MLEAIWVRFCDEHNLRTQSLKCNSSTAVMAVRSSIGVPALGMMIKTEGYASKEFGQKENSQTVAAVVRREVATMLKASGKVNGGGAALLESGKTSNGNGRPRKRGRNGKSGRVKGYCFKFNEADGCARDDCKFNHACEKCGSEEHGKSSCSANDD